MKQIVTITGENLNIVTKNVEATAATKKTKAQMRMEALKSAGVDVSNYYTLGADKLVRIEKGEAIPVDLDDVAVDAVGKKIVEGGYVNNWKLFRRWVTAQIFGMLRDMKSGKKSFNELLQRKGYEYQWRMLENEFHAQAKMQENGDTENLSKREIFFNECTFSGMVDDYIEKLKAYVNDNLIFRKDKNGCNTKEYKHRCKGVPYVRLNNKNIFVADLMKKVYVPLYKIARDGFDTMNRRELYNLVKKFNKIRKHLAWETKQSDTFISAYKGAGSYFAMRNLIMFSEARFTGKSEAASLRKIDTDAAKYGADEEGWRMLGVLKQLIAESNISIDGKLCVWAEESAFRKAVNKACKESK
jgi:glutaredoxin|nr:MAG TPA: hypothetical protein [Caudoviricetes sp.]